MFRKKTYTQNVKIITSIDARFPNNPYIIEITIRKKIDIPGRCVSNQGKLGNFSNLNNLNIFIYIIKEQALFTINFSWNQKEEP